MSVKIVKNIDQVRAQVQSWREKKLTIGFVATMGNLHEGHMDLFRTIAPHCDRVVCSIFANPLQFGVNEDFASYPRSWDADVEKLEKINASLLFAPTVQEMYGDIGMSETKVSVKRLNNRYCGATREGHFIGVATVVCKLLNIVSPHCAVFGEKDFQQLVVIRQMVEDLSIPVLVLASPTFREDSGLAYSSRNQYLNQQQRNQAPLLYKTLCNVRDRICAGESDWPAIEADALKALKAGGFEPDYLAIANARTLDAAQTDTPHIVVLAAARLGKARLIDNIQIQH